MDFREYIRTKLLKKKDRILEFGPLNWPIVTKERFSNAFYSDIRNSDDIKKLYTSNEYLESTGISINIDTIVDIDYVVGGTYKDSFKNVEKFDVVILGHVIEHIPNIIFFFQDVMNVLKKNGKLVIIYPDARYCFDHFRNGTTFIDAYSAYKSDKMNANAVFDFVYNVVHENDPKRFWNDAGVDDLLPKNKLSDATIARQKAEEGILPDDVHFWPFSDHQFIKFLYDMDRAGLLDLDISDFYETQNNTQEFMIILTPKKKKTLKYTKYQQILGSINPVVKAGLAQKEKEALTERILELEKVVGEARSELNSIYKSKKWRFVNRTAILKHRISKRQQNE